MDFTLGLGAAYGPDYEGSDDYAAAPLWNLRASDLYGPETYAQLLGTTFMSNLLPSPHWRLGVAGLYRFDYDDVDDDRVQDIKSTDAALLLGPTLGYDFQAGVETDLVLEVDALYDAAEGNGGVVTPRLRGKTELAPGLIGEARASTTWGSGDYMGNWFSVNSVDAARSTLDTFDADEGFKDILIGGSLTYRFAESWSLTGVAAYSRLLGDAADSPIIDDQGDANQFSAGALVNYRF
ncbi:MAG: MipA/OmpV family protein [Rhodospirillales bacterium]|nr:MipA/OmpV family protein [Rhodospirillales bacterium]